MIDRLERLINLVIALRETRRPLSADEIRRRVAGYGQQEYESFRRMFERDKADLRALGVPVETVDNPMGEDVDGYRINPKTYDLPPVAFEPDELAALGLALRATGLLDDAAAGLWKIEVAQGNTAAKAAEPGIELELDRPNRSTLTEAQLTRTRVRFEYRRSDGRQSQRVIEPHGMVFRRGHWYVVGRDLGRSAVRSFRLDRIVGEVMTRGQADAFAHPEEPIDVEAVLPPATEDRCEAVLAVSEELAWLLARRARGEGRLMPDGRMAYDVTAPAQTIVNWALEEGTDIEILEPDGLRQRVRERVDALLVEHAS